MEAVFDYNVVLNQAVQKIRDIRAPRSISAFHRDARMQIMEEETIFDFGGHDYDTYVNAVSAAEEISISGLHFIICTLLDRYGRKYEEISLDGFSCATSKIHFAIKDLSNGEVLFFKDPEESPFWKARGKEPLEVTNFLNQYAASGCKYIYLMYDRAFAQIIGSNDDAKDPGRGYNAFSLRWFFEEYFSGDEYGRFHKSITNYVAYIKQYLGYSVIKTLTPTAEVNFKRVVKNTLVTTAYERILEIKYEFEDNGTKYIRKLRKEDFSAIQTQYLRDGLYLATLGNTEYAESLITAEWLYDSMKNAQAIDLTSVAMGYFKSAEQFLSTAVTLLSPNHTGWSESPESSLGAIAHFFKDNLHLFRSEIPYPARKFIRESLFSYSNLRNGYMHKHNIHSWEQVDKIRDATLNLFFLMLGGLKLSSEVRTALGMTSANIFSDYYRLCEYVDYHAGELFFLCYGNGMERTVVALSDKYQQVIDHNFFQYSGAYFRTFAPPYQQGFISEKNIPQEIYLGELAYKDSESIQLDLNKTKKVFSAGKFVGPSIFDEKGENY